MNKKILSSIIIATTAVFVTANSFAELKRSSLSIAKTQFSGKLPQQCQKLFKEGDKLVLEAERQPGTHTQVKKMKDKLNSSKQKIAAMDTAMQQKSCDKGLIALNNLKLKY